MANIGAKMAKMANIGAKMANIGAKMANMANIWAKLANMANIGAKLAKMANIGANMAKMANIGANMANIGAKWLILVILVVKCEYIFYFTVLVHEHSFKTQFTPFSFCLSKQHSKHLSGSLSVLRSRWGGGVDGR